MKKLPNRPEIRDSLFLFGLIILSTFPYVTNLGFYSDDWAYLASLCHSSSFGIVGMFQTLLHTDPGFQVRPVQLACLVFEFKVFGIHAMPYHLLISSMLATAVVLFFFVLRAFEIDRRSSFAIALVFGIMPQYATDRFWLSSQQAVLCIVFASLGIYTLLRYTRPSANPHWWWAMCSSVSFVLSILSYEVALGTMAAAIALIAWRSYSRRDDEHRRTRITGIFAAVAPIVIIGLIKTHLQNRIVVHHLFPPFLIHSETWKHTAIHTFRFNLWNYLLHLPSVLAALYRHAAFNVASIVVSVTVAGLTAFYLWRPSNECPLPARRSTLWLAFLGFILFGLGYLLFLPSGSSFESVGIDNRVTIASALGAACVVVSLAILLSRLIGSGHAQTRIFAILIAITCGSYCLVVSGIAFYWVDAASRQTTILQTIRVNLNPPPNESTILLDGFCRYSGPAVVFETDWDSTGALQLTLHDPTLIADVISTNMQFNADAVDSTFYGEHEGHYPYGNRLFVFNTRSRLLVNLPSKSAADEYLRRFNPTGGGSCPPAVEGDGVDIFQAKTAAPLEISTRSPAGR